MLTNLLALHPMKALIAAVLVSLAATADAATSAKAKRGDMELKIRVSGTIVADDLFRIKSTIEGRVESVQTSTYVWHTSEDPLAFLAHRELAAMLDSKGTQNVDILEDRWQRVYRPTPARCPEDCFILKNFLKVKTWVKPESVMFEAAATLKLVGRVRPEDASLVRDGQDIFFWPVKDPKRILRAKVARYLLDIQGEQVNPGATFTILMTPDRFLNPGTEWEGHIVAQSKKDVIYVPTGALIRSGDSVYLPVRVSTGITTQGLTEIAAGVEERREVLVLDDAQLLGAERHKQEAAAAAGAPPANAQQIRQVKETAAPELGPAPPKKPGKHATVIDAPPDEDPYGEP